MGFIYTMLYIFEIKCGGAGLYLRGIGVFILVQKSLHTYT